jgi:hypothetical protein
VQIYGDRAAAVVVLSETGRLGTALQLLRKMSRYARVQKSWATCPSEGHLDHSNKEAKRPVIDLSQIYLLPPQHAHKVRGHLQTRHTEKILPTSQCSISLCFPLRIHSLMKETPKPKVHVYFTFVLWEIQKYQTGIMKIIITTQCPEG